MNMLAIGAASSIEVRPRALLNATESDGKRENEVSRSCRRASLIRAAKLDTLAQHWLA
jgi:hypothetical protein